MILEQHQNGMLDCLGQLWTWVCTETVVSLSTVTYLEIAAAQVFAPHVAAGQGFAPHIQAGGSV